MAIAFDSTSKADYDSGITSQTFSHTCSGSYRLLLVAVLSNSSSTDKITSVTYNGTGMTRLTSITPNSGDGFFWALYYMMAPPTGAHDVVATISSSGGMITMAASYTGVKQTGFPDAQVTSVQDNRTTYTQALTSVADNCWHFSAVCQNAIDLTSSTGVTERNAQSTKYRIIGDSNGPKTPAGSYSMSYTSVSGNVDYDTGWIMISFAPNTSIEYTLTAEAGSHTLTGNDVTIQKNLHLTADVGSYSLTGNTIDLWWGTIRTMVMEAGSYVLSGLSMLFGGAIYANDTKPTNSFSNDTKPTSSYSNDTKPTSSYSNDTKPSSSYSNDTKPSNSWINDEKL